MWLSSNCEDELLSHCLQLSLVGVTNVETKPVRSGMNIYFSNWRISYNLNWQIYYINTIGFGPHYYPQVATMKELLKKEGEDRGMELWPQRRPYDR